MAVMLAALLVLAASGAPGIQAAARQTGPTVGDLAVHLYGSLSRDQAVMQLAKDGVPVGDPAAPLTQGTLARVLTAKGIEVTTSTPDSLVNDDLYQKALQMFVQTSDNISGSGYVYTSKPAASIDLGSCLYGPAGQCMRCCLFLGQSGLNCIRFCSQLVPSPSNPG
jgi:hypothetical protein